MLVGDDAVGSVALGGTSQAVTGGGGGGGSTTEYQVTFTAFINTDYFDWDSAEGSPAGFESYLRTYYQIPDEAMTWIQSPYIYVFVDNGSEVEVFSGAEQVINSAGVPVVTDTASLIMNTIWDWSNLDEAEFVVNSANDFVVDSTGASIIDNQTSLKVSRDVQVYRFRNGYALGISKNKIRGRGKTLQLHFRSEEGKGFNLRGWTGWITRNQKY